MSSIKKEEIGNTTISGGRPCLRSCLDSLCGCNIDSSEYLDVGATQLDKSTNI